VVIGLEWTETVFTASEEFDWILPAAFAAFKTLDEAHVHDLSYSLDKGKRKSPVPNKHGAFF